MPYTRRGCPTWVQYQGWVDKISSSNVCFYEFEEVVLVKVGNADGTLPFYEVVFDELRDSGYVLPESIFD